jgi:hypothetical protein
MNSVEVNNIIKIIATTPLYVWAILAYLLFVGIKAMRNHIVYLPKFFIIPAVLIGLKYKVFFSENNIIYIGFMLLGLSVGFITAQKTVIKIFRELKSIELPGNYSTIIILITFFLIKYIFGYLEATNRELVNLYLYIENSISGILAGYFLGRSVCYVYRFYKAIYSKHIS